MQLGTIVCHSLINLSLIFLSSSFYKERILLMWNNPKGKKVSLKTALQCSPLFTQHVKRKVLLTLVVTKTLLPALFTVLSRMHHHPELVTTFKTFDNFYFHSGLPLSWRRWHWIDSSSFTKPFLFFLGYRKSSYPCCCVVLLAYLHSNTSASVRAGRQRRCLSLHLSPTAMKYSQTAFPAPGAWKQPLPNEVPVVASPVLISAPGLRQN